MVAATPDKTPRPPTITELTQLGCSEVLVRVSSYVPAAGSRGPDASMEPVEWQAIVKHVNASLPWAVAVRRDPDEAERDARLRFVEMNSKPHRAAILAAAKATKPAALKPRQKAPAAVEYDDMDDLI